MDLDKLNTETIRLTVHRYTVNFLLDRDIVGSVETHLEYLAHMQASAISTHLRLLGENTEPRLLASYPATLWDHVKQALGLKYRSKYVWQDETIVYPRLPVDKYPARIVVAHRYTEDYKTAGEPAED